MNRNFASALVIALASVATNNAMADDITIDTTRFTSTKSRTEVLADLAQYRQAGVNPWSTSYNPLKGFQSTRSAAQVRAEFVAARDEVAALGGEDSGAAWLAQAGRVTVPAGTTLAGTPVNAQ